MAKPIKTPKGFRLHFHYHGKQYKHGLFKNEHTAKVLQSKVNLLLEEIKAGLVEAPRAISIPNFIFGSVIKEPIPIQQSKNKVTLTRLIEEYRKYSVPPIKSKGTCLTEKYHMARLLDFIATTKDFDLSEVTVGFFNDYKKFRYAIGVRTDTVKKELGTFQSMFKLAVEHGWIHGNVVREVKRDKSQVAVGRFRTVSEIERTIHSGHYDPKEVKEIKRFAYLSQAEIKELIELARFSWLHPILIIQDFGGFPGSYFSLV